MGWITKRWALPSCEDCTRALSSFPKKCCSLWRHHGLHAGTAKPKSPVCNTGMDIEMRWLLEVLTWSAPISYTTEYLNGKKPPNMPKEHQHWKVKDLNASVWLPYRTVSCRVHQSVFVASPVIGSWFCVGAYVVTQYFFSSLSLNK